VENNTRAQCPLPFCICWVQYNTVVQYNIEAALGPDSERHSISDRTVNTGALLIAQIHGYLLGLKSIKTLIVGLQKI